MASIPTHPSGSPPRIAIIGGGISGLAAAHRLFELRPDAKVSLFEASSRLGGVLETVERQGFLIERSADNFLANPSAAVDLCRQLGMEGELVPTDESRRRAFVVHGGRLLPVPEGFYLMSPRRLWPVLRSPLLSLCGKLRLLCEPFVRRGPACSTVPVREPQSLNTPFDESVASFVRRRLGREVFERVVQPLVAGIYTADPEKLSMAATMPRFLEFERTHGSLLRATLSRGSASSPQTDTQSSIFSNQTLDANAADTATGARYALFLAPAHGMQSLVTKLSDSLPREVVQLKASVTSISRRDERWELADNPKSEIRNPKSPFDAVIVAVPAHAAAELLMSTNADLAAELGKIAFAGCVVVSFGFHRHQIRHTLDGFGFVVPKIERRRIIAASFASLKFPGRAPSEEVLIRVFLGGALQPEMLDASDADLIRIAQEGLTELVGIVGEPIISDIARWPRSMPQYHVGHLARVARIEELVASYPALALAGNAYHGVGIPQCIASGQAAAERVLAALIERKK
ncbi:MAG TPA: protoporphyrinogen oxidase [Lacipirellulaceae bacterium]|nr:protoporphyrinogen oxidase [Lacipirellulaceae bacterium]